jgi:hypothetical protein
LKRKETTSAGTSDGDVYMISLTIRTLPPSPNQRMHWAAKKKLRETFAKEIYCGCFEELESPLWGCPRKMILSTRIYWKTRRLDEDNAFGSLKILIDAMRDIGLIYRDSPKWLEVKKPIQMIDRENPRVEIELEETELIAERLRINRRR